jgi:hypothetical protein
MGLTRGNSVRVGGVQVPTRLLSTRQARGGWAPGDRGHEETQAEWPLQDGSNNDRTTGRFSLDTSSPRRDQPTQQQTYDLNLSRRLSNPVTIREADSVQSSHCASRDDLGSFPPPTNREETIRALREGVQQQHVRFDGHHDGRNPSNSSSSTAWTQERVPQRSGTVRTIVRAIVPDSVAQRAHSVAQRVRRNSIHEVYEKAKARGAELERKRWAQILFEYTIYTLLLCFTYFVLIGMPLWKGAVWWLYWVIQTKFVMTGGWAITIGIALM